MLSVCPIDHLISYLFVSSSHARDRLPNETFQWLLLDIRSQLLSICIEFLHCLHFDLLGETTNPNIPPSIDGMKMMMATMIGKSVTPTSTEITSKNRTEVLCLLFTLAESLIGQVRYVALLVVNSFALCSHAQWLS